MKYIKSFDILGKNYSFENKGSTYFKSIIFGIISILLLLTSIVLAILFGKEVIERKLPSVYNMNERIEKSEIFMNEFPFSIKFGDPYGVIHQNIEELFDVIVTIYYIDSEFNVVPEIINHSFNCSMTSTHPKKELLSLSNESYQYISICDNNKNYSFINEHGDINSVMIQFEINKCNSTKRKCADDLDEIVKEVYAIPTFINSYVDSSNLTHPIQYFLNSKVYQLTDKFSKDILFRFGKHLYLSDNGFLLESNSNYEYISLNEVVNDVASSDKQGKVNLLYLSLTGSNIRLVTKRSFMKIQDLIAKVGGFYKGLTIILSIFIGNYKKFSYVIHILELSLNSKANKNVKRNEAVKRMKNNYIPKKDNSLNENSNKTFKLSISIENPLSKDLNHKHKLKYNENHKKISYLEYFIGKICFFCQKSKINYLKYDKLYEDFDKLVDIRTYLKLQNDVDILKNKVT